MEISVIGLDLAKNVFQVHDVDKHGKAVLTKRLTRTQMANFFATLPRRPARPFPARTCDSSPLLRVSDGGVACAAPGSIRSG